MIQEDWHKQLAKNQFDLLPFLIGSIFGIVALTGVRDLIRITGEMPTGWYGFFTISFLLLLVALVLHKLRFIKPEWANTTSAVCALPVLFYPLLEILTITESGLLFLAIALLGVALAVTSMRHLVFI
ncbi:MAG: hypothetical protein MI746_13855 [Pseudomonadales bacterium]|nr:hypothetical protein [Pseudomonadales bacterium]